MIMVRKLLPTSLVGSYPQPDWLIDRERLAKQMPPRARAQELWRVAPQWLEAAQDDATILAIRDQEARRPRHRHGRRDPARELLQSLRDRARRHRSRKTRHHAQ